MRGDKAPPSVHEEEEEVKLSSRLLLKQLYKEYYFLHGEEIAREIRDIRRREFGYTKFQEGGLIRHLTMNAQEFLDFMVKEAPRALYHSSAYYLFPEKEMHLKEWMGADLCFDIDADHLPHRTSRFTNLYLCESCGERQEEGEDSCPKCGGSLREVTWLTEEDIEEARRETIRLIEVLKKDLGLRDEELRVYFSGGRGYHVHVYNEELFPLGQAERNEIVDYLRLTGYNIGYEEDGRRKTAKRILNILRAFEKPELTPEGRAILTKAVEVYTGRGGDVEDDEDVLRVLKELPREVKKKVEEHVKERETVGIDAVVTSDTHRLIRAPRSLHGKTGLMKQEVQEIDSYEPFNEAIGLPDTEVNVYVTYSPETTLKGREFGPYRAETVSLPAYAAAFLMGRGVADVR
jgi:DNA primase small subunit